MKNFAYFPLALSMGCVDSCMAEEKADTEEPAVAVQEFRMDCKFTLDVDALKADYKKEAMRLWESIAQCDRNIETQSEVALKKILDDNCGYGDQHWYAVVPTDMAQDPNYLAELAGISDLSYVMEHPEKMYDWNAKIYKCEDQFLKSNPSKKALYCTALFTEFSHAKTTNASFVTLTCTQDEEVGRNALANGASTELDLSKVRKGLDPNAIIQEFLNAALASPMN